MKIRKAVISIALLMAASISHAVAAIGPDTLILNRMFNYPTTVDTTVIMDSCSYSYLKYNIQVKRRNALLLPVPTMYRIAHGPRREYLGELYNKLNFNHFKPFNSKVIVRLSTIPHHQKTMPTMLKYLTPELYDETIIDNYLLSPFYRGNKICYKYSINPISAEQVEVRFRPKANNTQLVYGSVLMDKRTGRIISGSLNGEYDMITFHLFFTMGEKGLETLVPKKCELNSKFSFLGSKALGKYTIYFGLPKLLNDSIQNKEDANLMAEVRQEDLDEHEDSLYKDFYGNTDKYTIPSSTKKERSWAKRILWDIIGDNLLNDITSNYGSNNQGYVKINPLLNPLYMGYSVRKGFYYKFDIKNAYNFSNNSFIYAAIRAGYSFKQKQFYFKVPIEYHYNKRKHGYLELQLGNGNWIPNATARDKAIENLPDTAHYNFKKMEYFKDFNLSILNNYDLSEKLSFKTGFILHHREAVEHETYKKAGMPESYRTVAPTIELSYRPMGWKGPILNVSYERSIRGFMKSDIAYERWEADLQYIKTLDRVRAISFRGGAGTYTLIDGSNYFLDYTNFRDNHIPGGWNDEWSGEFELLPSEWYNLSKYYVRSNITYETPLLFLSWAPLIGHFIEKERIYASSLFVTHLHPYIEVGYGFTTRWVSLGFFMANKNGKYDGMGVKVELELFRHW
ncbi:MAG: DUF5686 family protein [Prevotella sp.]|jgi:hypothetical protein|nr:DUF5686 family protein [Prevotella sp.]MCI1281517.1 DUF5686 family protein [Prevotella sp.]